MPAAQSPNLCAKYMAASGGQRNTCSFPVGMLDVDVVVCELVLIGRAETTPEGSYLWPFGGFGGVESAPGSELMVFRRAARASSPPGCSIPASVWGGR